MSSASASDPGTARETEHGKQLLTLPVTPVNDSSAAHPQAVSQPPSAQPSIGRPGVDQAGAREPDLAAVQASIMFDGLSPSDRAEIEALQASLQQSNPIGSQIFSMALSDPDGISSLPCRDQHGSAEAPPQQQPRPPTPSSQAQLATTVPCDSRGASNQQLVGQDERFPKTTFDSARGAQSSPNFSADIAEMAKALPRFQDMSSSSRNISIDPDLQAGLQKELAVRLAKYKASGGVLGPPSSAQNPAATAPPGPAVVQDQGIERAMQCLAPVYMPPVNTLTRMHSLPGVDPPCQVSLGPQRQIVTIL